METNRERPAHKLKLSFQMLIGKTGTFHQVCLNQQVCLLLREFRWPGFHSKTPEMFARMTRWLGINGYLFKKVIMNLAAKTAPDLRLAQRLAGHQNVSSTQFYVGETVLGANLDMADNVLVPGLDPRFGVDVQALEEFYGSLNHPRINYEEFRGNWLTLFLTELYGRHPQNVMPNDDDIDFTSGERLQQIPEMNEEEEANGEGGGNQEERKEEGQERQEGSQAESDVEVSL